MWSFDRRAHVSPSHSHSSGEWSRATGGGGLARSSTVFAHAQQSVLNGIRVPASEGARGGVPSRLLGGPNSQRRRADDRFENAAASALARATAPAWLGNEETEALLIARGSTYRCGPPLARRLGRAD